MSKKSSICGLILNGGKSSRMGRDKGLISYHGKPQREHLMALLSLHCDEVFVSCKSANDTPAHLHPLPDIFEIESPLNGILSAFTFKSDVAWLSIPVDMPLITSDTIAFLLRHRDTTKLATCFYDSDGKKPEPLFTLWEPIAAKPLQIFYEQGNISPRQFLMTHPIQIIHAPDRAVLTNINSRKFEV
ncbi:MAG TPA: molybdenum cofactor guanylyltransferase [Ohtaekwangia sp.]|nr:molybdenum cofactor guanylyltransferase [Ohtaekwangia sp.]